MTKVQLHLPGYEDALLTGYLHEISPEIPNRIFRPCILICPGGGYEMTSDREADPVAVTFFAKGYQTFILRYSVKNLAGNLRPLAEISTSMTYIRKNAQTWQIRSDQIAVMGFSAGGHLAASLGTLWNCPELKAKIDIPDESNYPNALILCYPVICADEYAHRNSMLRVTDNNPELLRLFSLEKQVSAQTPPTFLWHTVSDSGVPVENTLAFVNALQKNKVPFECHCFADGNHGLSLCNHEVASPMPACAPWIGLCATWLGNLFDFKY